MPSIQTLTSEVQRLQSAVDLWTSVALWLTAFTALLGVGYFVASRVAIANGAKLRAAQATLASAQEEKLMRDLKDKDLEIARLRKAVRPRILDHKVFLEALKDKPKAKVEILYKRDDDEAFSLAGQIRRWLGKGVKNDGAGWDVAEPRPLAEADALKWGNNLQTAPQATKSGAWTGLGLVVREAPYPPFGKNEDTPVWALSSALQKAGVGGGLVNIVPNFPDNLIRIIVGPKMH